MAVSYLGGVTGSQSGDTVTFDLTSLSLAADDVAIITAGQDRGSNGFSTPTGFTELYRGTGPAAAIYTKVLTGSETSITFDAGNSNNGAFILDVLRGAEEITTSDINDHEGSGSPDPPAGSFATGQIAFVAAMLRDSPSNITVPSGYTQAQQALASGNMAVASAYKTNPSASENPGTFSGNDSYAAVTIEVTESAGDITLASASGSYTLTGQAATLSLENTTETGGFAIAGGNSELSYNKILVSDAGGVTITGGSSTLSISLASGTGNFAATGEDASREYGFDSQFGNFNLTGRDSFLETSVSAAGGTYGLTGNDSHLNLSLLSDTGPYTISAGAATLDADAGSFTITGSASTLTFGLASAVGAYSISGGSSTVTITTPLWSPVSEDSEIWASSVQATDDWTAVIEAADAWTKVA